MRVLYFFWQNQKYRSGDVRKSVLEVLQTELADVTYNEERSRDLSLVLSRRILNRVKLLLLDRYKIVCTVEIVEKVGQTRGLLPGNSIQISSKCLWDERYDNSTTVEYHNDSLFAVATIYALYTS